MSVTRGGADFEELDFRRTALGDLALRRRGEPRLGGETVYEVKLGDEFLMSSLFTVGERALAELGLGALDRAPLDVVVGGLGLGYTAVAALADARVRSLLVIEALGEVIGWHRGGLLPMGAPLVDDPRCRLVCGDFFALAARPAEGFDHAAPGRRFDAVLLDIDHSPQHHLDESSRAFYTAAGLSALAAHLHPGGVFAMWSNDPPDDGFLRRLAAAFASARAETVRFPNFYSGGESTCTVYVARAARAP